MNQTTKIIIGAIVLAVVAFWAGTAYANHQKNSMPSTAMNGSNAMGQGRGGYTGGMNGRNSTGGFVSGTVLSENSTSITIQNQAGGSKIILVSPTTEVSKSAQGSLADIAVGSMITATGTANTDGSITAQTVQIRPKMMGASAKAAPGMAQ